MGVRVGAGYLEHGVGVPLGGGAGDATSDANGHFQIGGLTPGVYNVHFRDSPRGGRFTARAVEGVRVKAGEDSLADLVIFEGRRLHGTAIYRIDNTPIIGANVGCDWGGVNHHGAVTDDQGRFEFFVPPGRAKVYIPADEKTVIVPADRDAEPVCLEINPNAKRRPDPWANRTDSVECPARVRVRADSSGRQDEARTLSGRIFDPAGRPVAGLRVCYNAKTFVVAATDRLGVFRMKGLPKGPFQLSMDKGDYVSGWSTIPADAVEVDLTLQRHPDAPE